MSVPLINRLYFCAFMSMCVPPVCLSCMIFSFLTFYRLNSRVSLRYYLNGVVATFTQLNAGVSDITAPLRCAIITEKSTAPTHCPEESSAIHISLWLRCLVYTQRLSFRQRKVLRSAGILNWISSRYIETRCVPSFACLVASWSIYTSNIAETCFVFFSLGDGIAYNHGNHTSKWILDLMAVGRSPHGLLHVHLFRCDGQPSSPLSRMKLKISRLG